MTQEEGTSTKLLSHSNKSVDGKVDKKKTIKKKDNVAELMTRVIVRQLPPTMTEQQFLEIVQPLPAYSEFYYVNGDLSLGEFAFSRAYFKFYQNFEELLIFRDKFDGYVFIDTKGNEYSAIVEYAPLQRMPRRNGEMKLTKQDSKINTIENDPDYIAFIEELNKVSNSPSPPPSSADTLLEEIEHKEINETDSKMTPLLEFIIKRREEKLRVKEEKQRKKVEGKKKRVEEKKNAHVKDKEKIKDPISQVKTNRNENSPDKKQEKSKPEITYVIKVNAEINKIKPSKPNTVIENKENQPNPEKKEIKAGPRIRNKDRPSREIYRPGTKQKNTTTSQTNAGAVNASIPETTNCSKPPSSTTKPSANVTAGPVETGHTAKPNKTNSQHYKFKNRVFTRTTKTNR